MAMHRCVGIACVYLGLSILVHAEVVVSEYNEEYVLGTHYDVTNVSEITILQPSQPGIPYDFDCYDSVTGEPAAIQSLTAVASIGNVEVKVSAHGGRSHGASSLSLLNINPTGVTGTVVELDIGGDLGSGGATQVDAISGAFTVAGTVLSNVTVASDVTGSVTIGTLNGVFQCDQLANFTATGTGTHTGSIVVHNGSLTPYTGTLHIYGSLDRDSRQTAGINADVLAATAFKKSMPIRSLG